jgi:hypothetical protein
VKHNFGYITLILALIVGLLVGCGSDAPASSIQEISVGNGPAVGAALDDAYELALPMGSQLALGTLMLEETEDAVTSAQVGSLLPLWQMLRSGATQSDSETNTVLKQIQRAMTSDQVSTIAAMQLTAEDLGIWAREQGVALGPAEGAGSETGGTARPSGMSEDERSAARATAQAGGAKDAGSRGARSAEAQTAGRPPGSGQLAALASAVVEMLSSRTVG